MKSRSFRQLMEAQSQRVREYFSALAPLRRFQIGTQNETRLKQALVIGKAAHLIDRTLLSKSVHQIHTARLAARLSHLCRGKANQSVGFVTILDSLELIDHRRCLARVQRFRDQLNTTLQSVRGLHLIGTIECEVVSPTLMRLVADRSESEERKLAVLESMIARQIKPRDQSLSAFFLIHAHAVVVCAENDWGALERACRGVWTHDARQVRLQTLSEQFAGKPRSLKTNLRFIARYITKGGNDFIGGNAYLRYKIGFENTDTPTEEEWVARNWRRSQALKQERIEEGIDDAFGLSVGEICALTRVIDGMMSTHPQRTGYAVEIKIPKRRQRRRTR